MLLKQPEKSSIRNINRSAYYIYRVSFSMHAADEKNLYWSLSIMSMLRSPFNVHLVLLITFVYVEMWEINAVESIWQDNSCERLLELLNHSIDLGLFEMRIITEEMLPFKISIAMLMEGWIDWLLGMEHLEFCLMYIFLKKCTGL